MSERARIAFTELKRMIHGVSLRFLRPQPGNKFVRNTTEATTRQTLDGAPGWGRGRAQHANSHSPLVCKSMRRGSLKPLETL